MKQRKNTDQDDINEDHHSLSTQDIQELILLIYKMHRSQNRMFQTLNLFARKIGKTGEFEQAFFAVLKKEKEDLKKIIENQLNYLHELGAPPLIIATKQQEKDVSVEVVENIKNLGSKKVLGLELKKLEELLKQNLFDVTSNFAGDTEFPFNLFQDDGLDQEWKYDLLRT